MLKWKSIVQVCVVHPYMRNTVYADKRKRRLSLLGEREEEEQVCRGQGTLHLSRLSLLSGLACLCH